MIRLDNVNKFFNKGKNNEIHVINNTTLTFEDSGLVALLGSSGCGKTTLLNAIGGLDKVNSGSIYINGEELTGKSSNKKDEIRNARIGYIFQNYNLIDDMTVFDNVAIALKMTGVKDKDIIRERVMYILSKVGLERYKSRPAKMLSGGERQRVGIARALVKNPKIVIADEPTGNLDSRNTVEIMNIIKAISRDRLVILVTHEKEIAEFYASRIIRIEDGRVIGDETNDHEGGLEFRPDNRIYLKDMPNIRNISDSGMNINLYSDEEVSDIDIKIVIKNGNYYIDISDKYTQGFEGTELIDDSYKDLSKEIYEEYVLDDELLGGVRNDIRYNSVFNIGSIIAGGFRKVKSYSIIKKMLLVGFVLAAMICTYTISNYVGIITVEDSEFVETNQSYVTVKTGKLNMKTYNRLSDMDGVKYAVPGDGNVSMTIPTDDYYQSYDTITTVTGNLAKVSVIDEENIIAGSMPDSKREIAIDKIVADNALGNEGTLKHIGIRNYDQLIGRTINAGIAGKFKIAAVIDQGSPSIYVGKKMFYNVLIYATGDGDILTAEGIVNYRMFKNNTDIKIVKGSAPDKKYEVMLPSYEQSDKVYVGSTIKTKVNGHKLTVCGFYSDKRNRSIQFVTGETAFENFATEKKTVNLCTEDKEGLLSLLEEKELNAYDNYAKCREKYLDNMQDTIMAVSVTSLIFLLVSLVEMYLMLNSSFLSRIKEVGILRAIGLKKKDIYKMFAGEIICISLITSIPGVAIMAYITHALSDLPTLGASYFMNVPLGIGIFIMLFVFNLIAGLIPVFKTMRKTPAQILARNDVN